MRTILVFAALSTCLIAAADISTPGLEKAHEDTQRRLVENAISEPDAKDLEPFQLTMEKEVTHDPDTGKVRCISVKTYRGGEMIEYRMTRDAGRNGVLDNVVQAFYVDGKLVCNATRYEGENIPHSNGWSFTTGDETLVMLEDKDRDGVHEVLGILRDGKEGSRIIEKYTLGEAGFYEPSSAEELYKMRKAWEAMSPMMSSVHNTIDEGMGSAGRSKWAPWLGFGVPVAVVLVAGGAGYLIGRRFGTKRAVSAQQASAPTA